MKLDEILEENQSLLKSAAVEKIMKLAALYASNLISRCAENTCCYSLGVTVDFIFFLRMSE